MPYNTRRKSLSLPSLGIHLPNASRSHRSPSASKASSATDEPFPPSKKVKRSHDPETQSPDVNTASSPTSVQGKGAANGSGPKSARGAYEHTPPPSPADGGAVPKVDTEGINDDVVVAAIQQLEKTGNRPHLVRELAAVLTTVNETVANSANPAALLSSRLSAYMKRPWTALSPCPIAKELIPVHPRKVYYYLTTCPPQPLPENLDDVVIVDGKRMTPSLSSASVDQDEEDALARERARLSPSPEVDLSSPEFEEDQADINGHAGNGFSDHRHHRLVHNHRAASPPLEGDEREFTQTASSVRERASEEKASRQGTASVASFDGGDESQGPTGGFPGSPMDEDPLSSMAENQLHEDHYGDYFSSHGGSRDREQDLDEAAAAALFGTSPSPSLSSVSSSLSSGTSVTSAAGSSVEGCDSGTETTNGLLSLKQSIADSVRGATPVSVEDLPAVSALKRTIDMVETGFSSKVGMDKQLRATFDFEMIIDSWSDLRSPETVEVDELDEMFGDI
ncbi:hypothetical protein VTN77DRAFT_172 [Rasamsonia byssochlamydoides]|uniref:uncharacterized protein n=1 Tax=Rasamsonia byssochlamydoides TaxID=89139 RepID=UPI003743F02D